uniref:Uncharacterized protein n=1 Tax=Lepeophtheirus salmonis TaxID=72036 RepID=A0A0K2T3B3_LEPSM
MTCLRLMFDFHNTFNSNVIEYAWLCVLFTFSVV